MKNLFSILFLLIISASLGAQKIGPTVLQQDQPLVLNLSNPGEVKEIILETSGLSKQTISDLLSIYITYDPMNWGEAVKFSVSGDKIFTLSFPPKYGAHVKLLVQGKTVRLNELTVVHVGADNYPPLLPPQQNDTAQPWMNANLPVEERINLVLAAMTPADKMELLREGWGIPGIPHLHIPSMNKVEALHGFSYGSGATIFPQSIAMGATWDKALIEKAAGIIGDETVSAHTMQAWSPVLDVAQDPRWGRMEETYGEDPVLVSQIGGAWIKGYQSKGLYTTPKHFAVHGAPLGGRDSHDIGLSEREIREIHLVPFRYVIKNYNCQSIMMSYNDYLGIPVAKSKELLNNILREEWGFNGYIVSDCGAIGNLTSQKHYTAVDVIDAANQALAAGIATNCGDTYNNPEVIAAAKDGRINMKNLDKVCRSLLRVMFANGLFENNPSKPLNWDSIYPGWNSPEHREVARQVSRESIVLLKNDKNILPLNKSIAGIAVIGPGADDLQPGDYTPKLQPHQLNSVLTGIKAAVGNSTQVLYEKGCDFVNKENYAIDKVLEAVKKSDVVVMVLGDCSTSESYPGIVNTSGENHDLATLTLQGHQQEMLETVCQTGKPVILVLQAGRAYDLSYAAKHASAILVNWLPGQEGGFATADVLFGDYNPAGRLPVTFPQNVGQVPLYYNFKTSGRRYEYVDLEYYPLYLFGFGLSYTTFKYSDLSATVNNDGTVTVKASVTNTGKMAGDEVAQLYVTDMYASVKTRVMELKNFERITLQPNETKTVSFTLTPYELSLLNDKMDRVVEPGDFKIMVGGKSPSYKAQDHIKDSVGFETTSDGVSTTIQYPYSYVADFELTYLGREKNLSDNIDKVSISIINKGNITDASKVNLFLNGVQSDEVHHYELDAKQEKIISFELPSNASGEISFVTKYKLLNCVL